MNPKDILSIYGTNNRLLGMHRERLVTAREGSAAFFEEQENVEFYKREIGEAETQLVELGLMHEADALYIEYAEGEE